MFWNKLLEDLYGAIIKEDRWKGYLQGLSVTLYIAAVAVIIGTVLGMLVAVVKIYSSDIKPPAQGGLAWLGYFVLKGLSWVCNLYTTVIRGTPIVVQLFILYSLSFMKDGVIVGIIGFGINSGAYVSEIFRAGINSVDVGQMEAGRSLGLSRNKTMRFIIVPQAVKNILPSLFNEFIALVKETSVVGYVAVNDLTKMANGIKNRTFTMMPLFIAALLYLILVYGLTYVQKRLERRLARSDRN